MHTGNYDILVDGEPIDGKRLLNIKIEANAYECPIVSLEYKPNEIEMTEVSAVISKGKVSHLLLQKNNDSSQINNALKKLRIEAGLSLGELSNDLKKKGIKIGRASLNNYERGKQVASPKTWRILADYYNVSVPYIMGLDTRIGINEITITKNEYQRLIDIEQKYNEIKVLVND